MKKRALRLFLFITLASFLSFGFPKSSDAQTIGITGSGSTGYPQTNIGNTTGTSVDFNGGYYLIVDPYTTTVPLTAITIRTYGTVSGTIKVTIYNDNSNMPGTKLFTEVEANVTANNWSTITIPNTYLPAGQYWLAYNSNLNNTNCQYVSKRTGVTGYQRKGMSLTYATSFPNNPAVTNLGAGTQDNIYFVGVSIEGYAKATKATLSVFGLFSSMSFYSHAAGNARLAIYNDASGVPSAKQWESGAVAVSASAWTTVNISTGTPTTLNLNAGTYWLAWQWNSAASGPSYTAGVAGDGNYMVQTNYGSFPANWAGGTSSSEKWSIYATYTACTPPTIYNVTGGGGYCSGGTGVSIYLSNSETGVNYELYKNSVATGTILPGTTGSGLTFTNVTAAGTYTIVATRVIGGCTNTMSGSATITVNPLPTASVTNQTNISCFAGNDGIITIMASGGTGPYSYSVDNGVSWVSSSTNPYPYGGLLANHAYQIRVQDSNGCKSQQIP